MHLKEAVATAVGSEAIVLQLWQQVAQDNEPHVWWHADDNRNHATYERTAHHQERKGEDWLGYSQSSRKDLSSEVFQVLSLWASLAQLRQREQCNKTVLSMRGHGSPCRAVRGDGCRPKTSIRERKMHCPSEGEGKEAKKRKWLSFYK